MCLCCDCPSFDCWPDKTWCLFFGIWNGLVGFIGLVSTSIMLDKELAKPKSTIDIGDFGIFGVSISLSVSNKFANETRSEARVWIEVIILICCILHLLSGICILLGFFLDMKIIFSFGKGMSHVLPWVGICSIILPIVQLICLFRVCRYYKRM